MCGLWWVSYLSTPWTTSHLPSSPPPTPPQLLLSGAGPDSSVFLASGYFNLTRAYMRLVLDAGANYHILTASPEVNGFFGAKGVAGAIPAAYTHIARQFYEQVCCLGQQSRVHLHEYQRAQWTFHAKGESIGTTSRQLPPLALPGLWCFCGWGGEGGSSTHSSIAPGRPCTLTLSSSLFGSRWGSLLVVGGSVLMETLRLLSCRSVVLPPGAALALPHSDWLS